MEVKLLINGLPLCISQMWHTVVKVDISVQSMLSMTGFFQDFTVVTLLDTIKKEQRNH